MRTKLQGSEIAAYVIGVCCLLVLTIICSCSVWGQENITRPYVPRQSVVLGFYEKGNLGDKNNEFEVDNLITDGQYQVWKLYPDTSVPVLIFPSDHPKAKEWEVTKFPTTVITMVEFGSSGKAKDFQRFDGVLASEGNIRMAVAMSRQSTLQPAIDNRRKEIESNLNREKPKAVTMNENPAPVVQPVSILCFTATTCVNCPAQKAVLDRLAREDKTLVHYVDINKEQQIAAKWGVAGITPTTFVIKRVKQPDGSYTLTPSTKIQGISTVEKMRTYVTQAKEGL